MRVRSICAALALLFILGASAWADSFFSAQSVSGVCATGTTCKLWYAPRGSVATNSSGAWSVTIPAGVFASAPIVSPMAESSDATLGNQASVQMVAPVAAAGGWTLSGTVTLPNTITVGGAPNKAAGTGVIVNILAVGS